MLFILEMGAITLVGVEEETIVMKARRGKEGGGGFHST